MWVIEVSQDGNPHFRSSSSWRRTHLLTLRKRPARIEPGHTTTTHHRPVAPAQPIAAPLTEAEEAAVSASEFIGLGLAEDVVRILAKAGITIPTPIQALTIPDVLAGRDVCGKARTGSGKTLAFGLPLIERTKRSAPRRPDSLVLAPTRELANQITAALTPVANLRNVRVATIYGGASLPAQAARLRAGVDLVVATPGRLNDLLERGEVSVADVTTVVIDEADQMADLGFLPQVARILSQVKQRHQTLLFSATLDGAVDTLIRRYQHDPVHHSADSEDDHIPEMTHRFIGVNEVDKAPVAAAIASGPERTLLFVRTQRGADRLVRQFDKLGLTAGVLHGGLSQPQRERALRAFQKGGCPVLVATNIAARGIHVDDVNIVVHYDCPDDVKTFLHRSGRTARMGAAGMVVTLVMRGELRDFNALRREAGLMEAVVPMTPDDPRLHDLMAFEPPIDDQPYVKPGGPAVAITVSRSRPRPTVEHQPAPAHVRHQAQPVQSQAPRAAVATNDRGGWTLGAPRTPTAAR